MGLGFLLIAIAAILTTVDCSCSSTTLYATTWSYSKSVYSPAYGYCAINIRPSSSYYSSLYYLEISWSSYFSVKGNMPFCKEDYIEVFLTSGFRSIGKFCSNNAGAPFTMYSRDGYAKIVFSANGYATSSAFTFYYRLKSKSSYPLGASSSSSLCYKTSNYGGSGEIYSTGWPNNYRTSSSSCNYKIYKSYIYQGIYVVFMDINMYDSYFSSDDCVQLLGSNTSSIYFPKAISSKLWKTNSMKTFKTYSSYLKIEFVRRNKPSYYIYRGFVAGYIMFSTPTTLLGPTRTPPTSSPTTIYTTKTIEKPVYEPSSSNSSTVGIVLGVLIPIIVIIIIVIAVVLYNKKKESPNVGITDHTHPHTTSSTVSTSHQTTAHQMLQTGAPPAYTNLTFSQPQQFCPTTSTHTVMYPTGAHRFAYPTAQPYCTGQFTSTGNAPPHNSYVVAPIQSSIPAGVSQKSFAPVINEQQPTGALHHAPSSFSSTTVNAPPIPSVAISPSAPPPSYQE